MSLKNLTHETAPLLADQVSAAYLESRLEGLRTEIKDGQRFRARFMLLMLLIAAFFELVVRKSVEEFDLGVVKVNDPSLVMKVLPAVFSFVFAIFIFSLATTGMLRALHSQILKRGHPGLANSPIAELLLPQSIFSMLNLVDAFLEGGLSLTPVKLFIVILFASILLAPPMVVAYMFWRCFGTFGGQDRLVWSSLGLSVILVCAAFQLLFAVLKIDSEGKFNV